MKALTSLLHGLDNRIKESLKSNNFKDHFTKYLIDNTVIKNHNLFENEIFKRTLFEKINYLILNHIIIRNDIPDKVFEIIKVTDTDKEK